jgi:DNA anti-recombination protein RmuC
MIAACAATMLVACAENKQEGSESPNPMVGENQAKSEVTTADAKAALDSAVTTASQAADEAVSAMSAKVEAFRNSANVELAELNRNIAEMKAKADNATSDTQEELKKMVADLQNKADGIKEKLAVLKEDSAEAMGEMEKGFNESIKEMKDAVEKAKARF